MSSDSTKFAFLSQDKSLHDLKSKNNIELKEMLDRQDHLLSNKKLIDTLKDKGEKIKNIRQKIVDELKCRSSELDKVDIIKNSTEIEWKENSVKNEKILEIKEDTNALKILSENGQIPKSESSKSYLNKLIEKETNPTFTFKPHNPAVATKVKNVVKNAHTTNTDSLTKTIHLDESLNLLSEQLSTLKVAGSGSKRVKECIEDRTDEVERELEDLCFRLQLNEDVLQAFEAFLLGEGE